jgi:hypothetical protein
MKNLKSTQILIAAAMVAALPLMAAEQKRVSPHETISGDVGGAKITVVYGRPYTKDPKSGEPRKVWGGVVPYGKVWRTGADEATILTTDKDIKIGDAEVPAGKYSLYTLPAEDGSAKLVINKQTGQWGTKYDEKQDLARVDMKKSKPATKADQFTMAIEGGQLKMMWEDTAYSVPIKAK